MSTAVLPSAEPISRGILTYAEAWQMQLALHQQVVSGERGPCILFLEHQAVLTLGKHSDRAHIIAREHELAARGVEVVQTDRGGEVTAHMPGQLVIYPILPLHRLALAPKAYVEKLLHSVIITLRDFGIEAYSDNQHPGVWVGMKKICAVGVRIRERVSMHGLALNIDNELSLFEAIVPCGISGRGVCSMQSILGQAPSRSEVEARFIERFFEVFGWQKMIN